MAKRAEAERKKDMLNYHLPTMASTWFVHKDDLMQFANSASVPDSIRAGLFELSEQYRDPSTIAVPLTPTKEPAPAVKGDTRRELVPVSAAPVPAAAESTPSNETNCPRVQWWRKDYDITDMAQNIGSRLHSDSKKPSSSAIAKEIEKRINAIERNTGRDRTSPNLDTIRPHVPKWRQTPG